MQLFISDIFRFLIFVNLINSFASDYFNQQPRIESSNGHIIFQSAENRNITFKHLGTGRILLNDDDLTSVIETVKQSATQLTQLKEEDIATLHLRIQEAFERQDKFDLLIERVATLETTVVTLSSLVQNETRKTATFNSRILGNRNQITRLRRRLNLMQRLLNKDECRSNPCKNGGKCSDRYNGYDCICPDNWQGATCDEDVNECGLYAGTPQGCQNGATCVNSVGSFECKCPPNWRGVHCNEKHDDCTGASSQELCGHGLCFNVERAQAGMPKYECICNEGWNKTVGPNAACVNDIDECSWSRYPCSVSPKVPCYNTQGSYICGSCPTGYTGNGHTCEDVNECLTIVNGGCSVNPMVQCTNTMGSRQCGPCPQGYQGDGVTCSQVNVCLMNNGGCSSLAICIANPAMIGGRECRCGPGYVGSGLGPYGCAVQTGGATSSPGVFQNPCDANPCVHGTCTLYGTSYHCTCQVGYMGINCESEDNVCLSHPCRNGGTCNRHGQMYTCTCASGYTGNDCQDQQQSCGGTLEAESGNLRYPQSEGINNQNNRDCTWIIISTWNKAVNVTFSEFNLQSGDDCPNEFLQINDGPYITSKIIGHFCGKELPNSGNIVGHSESLRIWFHSDQANSGSGFKLSWNAAEPECGKHLETTFGTIQSPNYPGKYPTNRDCYWTIIVPAGQRIVFQFHTIKLEEHFNCSFDFLEVRSGLSQIDPLLGRYCRTETLQSLTTPGSNALVYFHSDNFNADFGFHITYSTVGSSPGCGGELTAAHGIITSPGYPNVYGGLLECDWHISAAADERIKLAFTNFDVEDYNHCIYDYLEIWDASNIHGPSLGRFCGKFIPNPILSTSNHLFIKFKTDETEHLTGFRAEYKLLCGGDYSTPTGSIHSPLYPNNYPGSKNCVYRIIQPIGTIIILEFEGFDVEGDYHTDISCDYDYLEIRDGHNENSPLHAKLCGEKSPEPVVSTRNVLWLKFITDGTEHNKGFLARYRTEEILCGGVHFNEKNGTITSPEHPMPYPHGSLCTWVIQVPAHYVITIKFTTFNLEGTTGSCHYDFVELYDNSTVLNKTGFPMGKFCGSVIPPSMMSMGDLMTIVFKSDDVDNFDGFSATFEAIESSKICGGNYTSAVGFIRSPNYPNGYPNFYDCTWIIQVPSMQQVEINIMDLDLEYRVDCDYDYLEIRNGGRETSPLVGRYCRPDQVTGVIKSYSNRIYIHFHTDESYSGKGFYLIWDGTLTGCTGTMVSASGSLSSPNYPDHYDHSVLCEWQIAVSHGSRIEITISDLDIEALDNCTFDYLEIVDRGPNGTTTKHCGNVIPTTPIETTSNAAIIRFQSDNSENGRGFALNFKTNCSNTIRTGKRGVIESPNFPNAYPDHQNCTWTIQAPWGNKISLVFSHLDIERDINCSYDRLEIRDSTNPPKVVGLYCNSHVPPDPIISESEQITINFISDVDVSYHGFRLEWSIIGCGGQYIRNEGTLSSPVDDKHLPRVICEWSISVDYGHQIRLEINKFDMDFASCNGNSLQIFGGPDDTAPPMTSPLCHRQSGSTILTSMGNHMFLRYQRSVTASGSGFSASWKAVDGGCSQQFISPTGVITSPNYPNNYNELDDCSWLISVEEFHTIALQFLDFQLENHENCDYDFVEIFDGDSEEAKRIFFYCGSTAPTELVRSSSNKMYIRFKADGSQSHRGFAANYSLDCGGTLNANEGGIISVSPSFITYSYSPNCTWLIKADNPGDQVTLAITEIRILDSRRRGWNCSVGYLRVYNGDSEFAPEIGTYCQFDAPPPITSEGNSLYVVLTKGRNHSASNFFSNSISLTASYYESSSACGGNYTSASGAFNSPKYPDSYPMAIECIWRIKAPPGNRIHLSFSVFDIEDSEHCNLDYLEIHENDAAGRLLGTYCGSDIPSNLTAAESFWIKFRSSEEGTGMGFMAQYKLLFGNEIFGMEGVIASPLYPHFSNINGVFKWHITVPEEMYVQVEFQDFAYNRTIFKSTTLYDGGSTNARVLARLSGNNLPDPLVTRGNELLIIFPSARFSRCRFLLSWKAISELPPPTYQTFVWTTTTSNVPGCGGSIRLYPTNSTNLTSPGYPYGYERYLTCVWILRTTPGYHINLKFINVDLVNYYYDCRYQDFVEMYDGTNGMEVWENDPIKTICKRDDEGTYVNSTGHFLKVIFKSKYENRTGFFAKAESVCGGFLYDSEGVLSSPKFPSVYPINQNCEWLIAVKPGRTIIITWIAFDIEQSDGCTDDYIILRNGASKDSPLLLAGKYCGSLQMPAMNTTSNYLYAKFVSDNKGSNKGFVLHYQEESINCGGNIILSSNNVDHPFHTPNFPRIPPPHLECKWIIIVPPFHRVQVDFDPIFDVMDINNCSTESVEGYDGGTINSDLIFRKCGKEAPATIWSTGSTMLVRYFTDTDNEGAGFKAYAKIAVCGGTFASSQGIITSPDYPKPYLSNLNCEWKVRGPTGHDISFQMVNYELPSAPNCSTVSHVSIRDFDNKELHTFCGYMYQIPVPVNSSDNEGLVYFQSTSNSERYKGFKLRYNASVDSCGDELTTASGTITSPNYPGLYPHKQRCFWKVIVPQGRRIRLEFTHFDLEEKSHYSEDNLRCVDRLLLLDGAMVYSPLLTSSLCGNNLQQAVYRTSGNELGMYFFTDGDSTGSGFSLTYTSDEPAVCGGYVNTFPKLISSPTGPSTENTSVHCIWEINTPETESSEEVGTSLVFNVSDFNVEARFSADLNCYSVFLKILTGSDVEEALVLYDLCGNLTDQTVFVVPFSKVWLRYKKSMYSNVTQGFNLTYSIQHCGGVIRDSEFTLVTPNYPNEYGLNVHCAWAIVLEDDQQIKLTFDEFNLDGNSKDYVIIYNGLSPANSPKFGIFNATHKPSIIHSMGNSLWIEFHSDNTGGAKGFKASGYADSGGCTGHYHADTGTISSLNYPSLYPNDVECSWEVTLSNGYHANITFINRFDIQTSDSCSKDFVAIYEEINHEWKQVGANLCGKEIPQQISTTKNKFKVMFRTDSSIDGEGFKLVWNKSCGGFYNESSGQLYSPGYPQQYGVNLVCDYLIETDSTHYIKLEFDEAFDLENDTTCNWDSVEVFQGRSERGMSYGKYCGTTAPGPFVLKGGTAFIRFISDPVVVKNGFLLNYVVQECGGNLTGSSGMFRTPTHPLMYLPSTRCTWVITIQEGFTLEVIFIKFDMEDLNCQYDYVRIYDGNSIHSPLIGTFCGTRDKQLVVRAKSNSMTIYFHSDEIIHLYGFEAAYRSTYGEQHGCGGYKNMSSGSISSLDYDHDGNYEPELNCIWLIETPQDQKILKLTFDKFNIEAPDDLAKGCPWDYLEIRDGFSENSRLIDRFCGISSPGSISTSGKSVWIKFVSDPSHNKAGFIINFISIPAPCGGNLVATNYSKELTSPDYPYGYSPNTRCEWNITADRPDSSVELTFLDFDLENSTKCTKDYLELRDASDIYYMKHFQLEGTYCGKKIPHHFQSFFPNVKLNFVSDYTHSRTGFKLQYRIATCNKSYGEEHDNGRIRFNLRNFVSTDPCITSISTTEDRTIALYFSIFQISWSHNCSGGYLKVFDGSKDSDPLLTSMCGYSGMNSVYSTGNNLLLVFKPPFSYDRNLIDITYTTTDQGIGCGGTVSGINGTVTSPYYPSNYSVDNTCQWLIQGPPGATVEIHLYEIDLPYNAIDSSDCLPQLSIYDGKEADLNKRVAYYCRPNYYYDNKLVSTDNEMLVQYTSTANNTRRGFRLSFSYSGWKEIIPETIPKD